MRIVASSFGSGDLVWLHNPQRKKGISPKLRRPWEGPYVIVERLNDVVYRIQRGSRKKLKVVHRDRLWKCSGIERADWFQGPVQDKNEDVSSRTTTQQEHQEVNSKGRHFLLGKRIRQPSQKETEVTPPVQEEELPAQGGVWQGIEAAAGPGGPQAIQQERRNPLRYRDNEMTWTLN